MIQDVKAFLVSIYFNPAGAASFFIPKNWDALFDDLDELPSCHFLGSIICANSQKNSMAASNLSLNEYNFTGHDGIHEEA